MKTFGEIIKLGDLPIEEKEQINDSIIYSAEHEGELFSEVNHVPLDENKTSMTFTRSYLPKIDKTSDRYKNGLVEGVTPDPEKINEAEFSVAVNENGWFYPFTNKALNHAWTDIKKRCSKFLQNLFKTYHDEKIADAYLSSANIVTSIDLLKLTDLLQLSTMLYKNNAVTFGGFYKLKVAPEVADKMLVAYKDIITHTTEKEAVVNGEIGEIGGFRVIKSRLQAFQKDSSKGYPFIAYGKTSKDEFPVSICSYDNLNAQIIFTPLGGLGNDPLKQRGAIGLHVDGHGFYVFDDAICVTGYQSATDIASVDVFDNTKRSHLVRTNEAASNINVNASVLKLKVGETYELTATDGDGNDIQSSVSYSSLDATIATVDAATAAAGTNPVTPATTKGKVKAIKKGLTRIVVEKGNLATLVTVEVI